MKVPLVVEPRCTCDYMMMFVRHTWTGTVLDLYLTPVGGYYACVNKECPNFEKHFEIPVPTVELKEVTS